MHYYDCYIFASAAAAALTVTFIIGRKDKIKRRTCAVVCVIALLYSINMFCQRDNFSLEGYNKMLSSRTVIAGGETVELPQMNGCVILGDVTARPVYAMGGDVTEICTLEFPGTAKMRICKLADPRLYPENVSHEYRGQYYCFLSDKLFYRNAFYMFSDEYAAFLLSNILDSRDLPLAEPIIAEYPYDATDIKEHIAYSDHVFVGKVTSVENYWASEKPKMLSDDGETYNTKLPFTEYCVEVIEPIKGELEAAETIRIRKTGGLNYLEDKVIMLADDILPEKGKRYIFLVTENKDGIMSATGAYSAIPIDGGEKYSTYPDGVTFGETEIEKYKESAILIDKSLSYIRGIK